MRSSGAFRALVVGQVVSVAVEALSAYMPRLDAHLRVAVVLAVGLVVVRVFGRRPDKPSDDEND